MESRGAGSSAKNNTQHQSCRDNSAPFCTDKAFSFFPLHFFFKEGIKHILKANNFVSTHWASRTDACFLQQLAPQALGWSAPFSVLQFPLCLWVCHMLSGSSLDTCSEGTPMSSEFVMKLGKVPDKCILKVVNPSLGLLLQWLIPQRKQWDMKLPRSLESLGLWLRLCSLKDRGALEGITQLLHGSGFSSLKWGCWAHFTELF